jgi:hypothetical protein
VQHDVLVNCFGLKKHKDRVREYHAIKRTSIISYFNNNLYSTEYSHRPICAAISRISATLYKFLSEDHTYTYILELRQYLQNIRGAGN